MFILYVYVEKACGMSQNQAFFKFILTFKNRASYI